MEWPPLPLDSWRESYASLHRCLQIVGKVQLALTPPVNHFWNVAFEVSARGLITPAMEYPRGTFAIEMDFVDHAVVLRTSSGAVRSLSFLPRPVAEFYRELMMLLDSLGIEVSIWDHPVELQSEAIPFPADQLHAAYDQASVSRWWQVVSQSARVFEEFRAGFLGKASPVQFYWGSFDLTVSRFSGRRASPPPGAGVIEREAYSHEVSSVGFWPGDPRFPDPAYFAYTAPKPPRYEDASVVPREAFWHPQLREFILPYEAVRQAQSPRRTLLDFCQSTYEVGADLAGWDRSSLERLPSGPAPTLHEGELPAQPPLT